MNDKQSRGWGGKREGAGRPADYSEPKVQKTCRLPQPWIDELVDEFGTFQAAIEALAKAHLGIERD